MYPMDGEIREISHQVYERSKNKILDLRSFEKLEKRIQYIQKQDDKEKNGRGINHAKSIS